MADFPATHHIKAALVCARVISSGPASEDARRAAYADLPTDGLFDLQELRRGEDVLLLAGLARKENGFLAPLDKLADLAGLPEEEALHILVDLILISSRPLWIEAAMLKGVFSEELVPQREGSVLDDVLPIPERREAMLLQLARQFDWERNQAVGALGEDVVVDEAQAILRAAGRRDLAAQVRRVSLISDQLGYDVFSPTLAGGVARMEVKTSASSRSFRIFLSRNEAEVGRRDPMWSLVACRLQDDRTPKILGWCRFEVLEPRLPTDTTQLGRWVAAELHLSSQDLKRGLPLGG
jgi:hypothetical protein